MSEARLVGVRGASEMLGISEYMVRHWARKGELRSEHLDGGVAIVFDRDEVTRFREMIKGLTANEAGSLLGVSAGAMRNYVARGEIAARKALGELRFDDAEVRRFARERGIVVRELAAPAEERRV